MGTLLVAHGGDATWNAQVLALARECHTGGPVSVAFLMGDSARQHRFEDAAAELVADGATEIVVVPLLVSSHSGHYQQIRWLAGVIDSLDAEMRGHLEMLGIDRATVSVPVTVTAAIDDAPELAHILTRHALALTTTPHRQALFLVGHGPNSAEDYAAWMDNLRPVADSIRVHTGFADVKVGLVRDDAPAAVRAEAVRGIRDLIDLQARVTKQPVVVVPILLSRSTIGDVKFRHDLTRLPIIYSGDPILPSSDLARWVERRVRDAQAPLAVSTPQTGAQGRDLGPAATARSGNDEAHAARTTPATSQYCQRVRAGQEERFAPTAPMGVLTGRPTAGGTSTRGSRPSYSTSGGSS